jgi:hypothetical protein
MEEEAHFVGDTKYLAHVLRSFTTDFTEHFGFPMETPDEFTDQNVENYVKANLHTGIIKEKENHAYLEMAPPNKLPANPGVKLATPMATYRQYLDEFVVSCPYDYEHDVLATTPHADAIATHVGAVIFNENSVDKPHKPIYVACAEFINNLTGTVLVVGDVNGAVTIKMTNSKARVLPVSEFWAPGCYTWLDKKRKMMMEWDEVSAEFDNLYFDHVVYLFRGEKNILIPDEGSRKHYLDFVPGKFLTYVDKGKYALKGKFLTVYESPGLYGVLHTVLFGAGPHAINYQVQWKTAEIPGEFSSSMIPLSPQNAIGWPDDLMCSEKKDGEPVTIIMKGRKAAIIDKKGDKILFEVNQDISQVLLCEKVGNSIYVLEPVCTDSVTFGDWLATPQRRTPMTVQNFKITFKPWYDVTEIRVKSFLEGNYEGVCFKRKNDIIGQMDPIYRKISTYYVKNPLRASYEDYVHVVGETILQGVHSVYRDPRKVYSGEGVYEVKANPPYELIRKRDKERADSAWYVDSVRLKFNYEKFLISVDPLMFEVAQDGLGGLVHLSRKRSTIAKENCVIKSGINIIYRTGFHFSLGHKIYALGKEWRVSVKRENKDLVGIYDYHCVLDRGRK